MKDTVEMDEIPKCDFCKVRDAKYDGKTISGSWAYMCDEDWDNHGLGKLGLGLGQRLVKKEA